MRSSPIKPSRENAVQVPASFIEGSELPIIPNIVKILQTQINALRNIGGDASDRINALEKILASINASNENTGYGPLLIEFAEEETFDGSRRAYCTIASDNYPEENDSSSQPPHDN